MNEEISEQKAPELDFEENERISLKILMADDNAGMRTILGGSLQEKYSSVTIVKNGQELLDKLNSSESYDIVLTDNNMPIKTGIEAIQEIRSSEKESVKNTKIILMTDDNSPETKSLVESLGATFIDKADLNEKLFSIIDELTKEV